MSRAVAQPTEQERAAAAAVPQMNAMAAEAGHAPAAPETGPVTPEAIMEVARGFMAAKHLFAASSIGIFEALADRPATVAEIAARAGISERAAHISADAMVALGFLYVEQGHYSNGPAASAFLAGRTPADLRPVLRFWDRSATRPGPNWNPRCAAAGRRSSSTHDCRRSSRPGSRR